MITLVLILFLSPLFGGEIEATLSFKDFESCQKLTTQLKKFEVKHEIKQFCEVKS